LVAPVALIRNPFEGPAYTVSWEADQGMKKVGLATVPLGNTTSSGVVVADAAAERTLAALPVMDVTMFVTVNVADAREISTPELL
jgi:hypothetical protein